MFELWMVQINSLSPAQSLTLILLSVALVVLGFIYNGKREMEGE